MKRKELRYWPSQIGILYYCILYASCWKEDCNISVYYLIYIFYFKYNIIFLKRLLDILLDFSNYVHNGIHKSDGFTYDLMFRSHEVNAPPQV
jgi:hypothetical protein